jgi:hypothetical protein
METIIKSLVMRKGSEPLTQEQIEEALKLLEDLFDVLIACVKDKSIDKLINHLSKGVTA